ncbi:MAG: glycosyltransferase [Stellaceae bacterium]
MPAAAAGSSPVVLSVGIGREASGFGRQLGSMFAHLAARYELHHLGIDYLGARSDGAWTLHPAAGRSDIDGCRAIAALAPVLRPAVVLVTNDLWKVGPALAAARRWAGDARLVVSSPVDGEIMAPDLVDLLAEVACLAVYTESARATVANAARVHFGADAAGLLPRMRVMPHGVDTTVFRPLDEQSRAQSRLSARRRLFPDRPELWDSFIVLNANMNLGRKRLDLTLDGFARFARDLSPNVRLLIHAKWHDWACDVRSESERLGIADRLLTVTGGETLSAASDEVLNLIYNATDVGLSTSMGEGWGFVPLEHAAAGVAQIVPRHSALAEIWQGSAEFIEPVERFAPPGALLALQVVSGDDVAAALRRLYRDPARLSAVAAACHANATRPDFRWAQVAARWDLLFCSLIDGSR